MIPGLRFGVIDGIHNCVRRYRERPKAQSVGRELRYLGTAVEKVGVIVAAVLELHHSFNYLFIFIPN